jgi:mannose-6-phosphate isomerase-like protein (cupin superfamily)
MGAIVNGPGEGERLGPITVIMLDRPELGLFNSGFEPGLGTVPHTHRKQADAFYVLEGELEAAVDTRTARIGPGGLVAAPPRVTHSVRNPGPGPQRHLNLHAPGTYFLATSRARARGEPVDDAYRDSFGPEDGGEGVLSGPGEGEFLRIDCITWRVKAVLDEMSILEGELDPGREGASPHRHERYVEAFYILEGELEFVVDSSVIHAGAGTSIAIPPRVVHALKNATAVVARFVSVQAPNCGFVDLLRAACRGDAVDPARFDSHLIG